MQDVMITMHDVMITMHDVMITMHDVMITMHDVRNDYPAVEWPCNDVWCSILLGVTYVIGVYVTI